MARQEDRQVVKTWENGRWQGWKKARDVPRSTDYYINTITGHHQWDEPMVPASQRPNRFGPHELPLIVQMLWRDKHIFSKSWKRDLWVVMKNRRARGLPLSAFCTRSRSALPLSHPPRYRVGPSLLGA